MEASCLQGGAKQAVNIAFLLTIHNNPEQVNLFLKQLLQYPASYIYIHVDAKSLGIIPQLIRDPRICVLPRHIDVRWGDYTQIQAVNYLLETAIAQRHHDFYSLHSGADLLIRPVEELIRYLQDTYYYGYYDCRRLPKDWAYKGGLGRIALRWPKCFRNRVGKHSPVGFFRSVYGKLYDRGWISGRKLPEKYDFYGGADWFTVREDCAKSVLAFSREHPDFEELFRCSLSGSEIYYVSIFQMTKGQEPVLESNMLRYIDWKERGQIRPLGSPNICTMDFLKEVEQSGAFFARKFDRCVDAEIIQHFYQVTIPGGNGSE